MINASDLSGLYRVYLSCDGAPISDLATAQLAMVALFPGHVAIIDTEDPVYGIWYVSLPIDTATVVELNEHFRHTAGQYAIVVETP